MTGLDCLDLSLPTPPENLACDEALLDACEAGEYAGGVLRFWEPSQNFVVLGYANHVEDEVHVEAAKVSGVPIFRRCSGGGTVLQAPGCLNYSLVLKIEGHIAGITETNRWIMGRNGSALQQLLGVAVTVRGHTDLAVGSLKFSGNAQRRKKHWILFHGTFLRRVDVDLMERLLKQPGKQPAYRRDRSHREFVTSVAVSASAIKETMRAAWNVTDATSTVPWERINSLVAEKYSTDAWNLKW